MLNDDEIEIYFTQDISLTFFKQISITQRHSIKKFPVVFVVQIKRRSPETVFFGGENSINPTKVKSTNSISINLVILGWKLSPVVLYR